ncbi:hypothetical protein [Pseudomonas sp. Marseille-QA0332]
MNPEHLVIGLLILGLYLTGLIYNVMTHLAIKRILEHTDSRSEGRK